jgi:hypothetical protein
MFPSVRWRSRSPNAMRLDSSRNGQDAGAKQERLGA